MADNALNNMYVGYIMGDSALSNMYARQLCIYCG